MFRKIKIVLVIVAVFQMVTIYSMEEQQSWLEGMSCEMVQHIAGNLSQKDICNLVLTCRYLNSCVDEKRIFNVLGSNKETAEIPQWMNEEKYWRNKIALSLKYCAFNNSILLRGLSEEIKKRIISLNLSSNGLRTLPEGISSLSKLKSLDLGYNRLKTLPEEIGYLTKLKSLDLGSNRLRSLPEEISQLSNLAILRFLNNNLSNETVNALRAGLPNVIILK